MDIAEIKKKLAEMQSKLKPIEKGETTIKVEYAEYPQEPKPAPVKKPPKATPPKPVEVPVPEPVPAGVPCLNVEFKDLIMNLTPSYIGQNSAKKMLIEILGTIPDCPGEYKVGVAV